MELRALQRKVLPENWQYVARDVAILVDYTNKSLLNRKPIKRNIFNNPSAQQQVMNKLMLQNVQNIRRIPQRTIFHAGHRVLQPIGS